MVRTVTFSWILNLRFKVNYSLSNEFRAYSNNFLKLCGHAKSHNKIQNKLRTNSEQIQNKFRTNSEQIQNNYIYLLRCVFVNPFYVQFFLRRNT